MNNDLQLVIDTLENRGEFKLASLVEREAGAFKNIKDFAHRQISKGVDKVNKSICARTAKSLAKAKKALGPAKQTFNKAKKGSASRLKAGARLESLKRRIASYGKILGKCK